MDARRNFVGADLMDGYRYPISELRGDYIRAVAGMLFFGMFLFSASSVPVMFFIIGSIFLLFLGFAVQTWSRHSTVIRIEPHGLRFYSLRRREIAWDDLSSAKLRFFTVKRDRDAGWMELTLFKGKNKTKIDSRLEGFNDIAAAVANKIEEKGVTIDENSVENFNALGIITKSPGLPEAAKKFDKVKPWQDNI